MEIKGNDPVNRSGIVRKHPGATFFILAYLIGLAGVLPAYFLKIAPLALIAAYSSTISGIITAALYGGKSELKSILKSMVKVKCGVLPYVYALVIPIAIVVGAISVNWLFGNPIPTVSRGRWMMLIPYLIFFSIQAGLGEELGWRGFAFPKLIACGKSALASSLIVGVVWALWHTPLYFIPGQGQYMMAHELGFWYTFVFYGLHVVSASVVYCWLYLRSGKSVLLPIIIHGTVNALSHIYEYENFRAVGGMVAAKTVTVLWILIALIIVLRSPYFNKRTNISLETEQSLYK